MKPNYLEPQVAKHVQFTLLTFCCPQQQISHVYFQRISILSPQQGLEFPGGGGSLRPKHLTNLEFPEGWGILKIPSMGVVVSLELHNKDNCQL